MVRPPSDDKGIADMTQAVEAPNESFLDRRNYVHDGAPGRDRRQFINSYSELSQDAQELAMAIDQYKLLHRRRFITYEEMLSVFQSLGYEKTI